MKSCPKFNKSPNLVTVLAASFCLFRPFKTSISRRGGTKYKQINVIVSGTGIWTHDHLIRVSSRNHYIMDLENTFSNQSIFTQFSLCCTHMSVALIVKGAVTFFHWTRAYTRVSEYKYLSDCINRTTLGFYRWNFTVKLNIRNWRVRIWGSIFRSNHRLQCLEQNSYSGRNWKIFIQMWSISISDESTCC